MKKISCFLLCFFLVLFVQAEPVRFRFSSESSVPAALKRKMEQNATRLLTEIQAAYKGRRALNLANVPMEAGGKEHLNNLWAVTRFELDEVDVVKPCLEDFEGYQARDIQVNLKPVDPETFRGELMRSLTISFNKKGQISGARFALPGRNVGQVMNEGSAVTDLAERRMVLKFLEDFQGYYNERNIGALEKVYSDDALIITGSVVQKRLRNSDVTSMKTEIRYNKMNKDQYLKSLASIFQLNKEAFHIEFDQIEVVAHAKQKGYYGVKVHQKWDTKHYSDDGWVFLLWDFRNPDEPTIHVRTWQPYDVPEHDIFSIGDFQVGSGIK